MDEKHYLSPLFEPRSVAIIGATEREGTLGDVLVRNMLAAGYGGVLSAVNPKHDTVHGIKCYSHIRDVASTVDLAVIATPAKTLPDIVDECGKAGVRMAVILSAGFGGVAGDKLRADALDRARRHGLRLLGPNSLGVARPSIRLNSTFAHGKAIAGSVGFISQSGALCAAMLDYAWPNQIGFSNVVSLGMSCDLDFGEILDYMVWDFRTESVLLYIEGVRDARRFLSALRAAARFKPIMVLKPGRNAVGLRAAQQHTGAPAGDDAVFDAALRRAGVVRLGSLSHLYATSKALFAGFRPRGNRLAIITNGGGPGVLAADRAGDLGIPLARLSAVTLKRLAGILPSAWPLDNPLDLVGDSDPDRYAAAFAALLDDDDVDGVLCLLTPQAMTQPTEVARRVIAQHGRTEKPVLTSWLGEDQVRDAREAFRQAGIPSLRTPETAVELFSFIHAYYRNQQLLAQVPPPLADSNPPDVAHARKVIDAALRAHRTTLLREEVMAVLAAFHIPVPWIKVVHSAEEATNLALDVDNAIVIAANLSVPGVRQRVLEKPRITADDIRAACVGILEELQLRMPEAIRYGICIQSKEADATSIAFGIKVWRDPVFGPAIGFGEHSASARYWPDRAVALPPLNAFLVGELMRDTYTVQAMRETAPASLALVEKILLRVSELVCELPEVIALDLDPLHVGLDFAGIESARIDVARVAVRAGTYDHMAIHPYPAHLISQWHLGDGTPVLVRPLKPEDAELEQRFVQGLSAQTRYFRFMNNIRELTPATLARLTQLDYDRELALIALIGSDEDMQEIGVCRYATNSDGDSCEFALVVADAWQHQGVGRYLMQRLIEAARARGLRTMKGIFLASNDRMLHFVQRFGFIVHPDPKDHTLRQGILALLPD